jgi:hypothetical protein
LSELNASLADELASPQGTTASLRLPLSDVEAKYYYHGLPSKPILVARTGTDTWKLPTGPWPHLPLKELRTVGNHPLMEVWEDGLAIRICKVLNSMDVKWTSMDLVRIGVEGESVAPVIVWIGSQPDTLSGKDGLAAAQECKKLLVANDIHDVEVEIRESVVWGGGAA